MTLFFVLSGFVIQYNYSQPILKNGWRAVCGFMWARFARLYPLYFTLICLDYFRLSLHYFRAALFPHVGETNVGVAAAFGTSYLTLPYYLTMIRVGFINQLADIH